MWFNDWYFYDILSRKFTKSMAAKEKDRVFICEDRKRKREKEKERKSDRNEGN